MKRLKRKQQQRRRRDGRSVSGGELKLLPLLLFSLSPPSLSPPPRTLSSPALELEADTSDAMRRCVGVSGSRRASLARAMAASSSSSSSGCCECCCCCCCCCDEEEEGSELRRLLPAGAVARRASLTASRTRSIRGLRRKEKEKTRDELVEKEPIGETVSTDDVRSLGLSFSPPLFSQRVSHKRRENLTSHHHFFFHFILLLAPRPTPLFSRKTWLRRLKLLLLPASWRPGTFLPHRRFAADSKPMRDRD